MDIGWRPLAIESAYLVFTSVTALFTSDRVFWAGCILGWVLLALALTDLRTLLLPDKLTLPLIIAGIIEAAFFNAESVFDHIVAAAIGFLSFYIIIKIYRALTGREGLGLGDAKLFAATGAWLGALALPGALLIAASTAIAVELMRRFSVQNERRQEQIAFGPYLAFATWLGWVIGPLIPVTA
jgi:leader peptidase (prepilin peptidase)/N-methyltransferase